MFRFLRKKKAEKASQPELPEAPELELLPDVEAVSALAEGEPAASEDSPKERKEGNDREGAGLFDRLRFGLAQSRGAFGDSLGTLLLGRKEIDESLLEALETQLLTADVGLEATEAVLERLTARVKRGALNDEDALMSELAEVLSETGRAPRALFLGPAEPFVILVVGVNGVGKTTTIGAGSALQGRGAPSPLAAGDTFLRRSGGAAEAVGRRADVPVIAQGEGADSASVLFDAVSAARARSADVVLADTAGGFITRATLWRSSPRWFGC